MVDSSALQDQTITTDGLVYSGSARGVFVTYRRSLMRWLVPEVGLVEMYVNPQNIVISNSKSIKHDRTKGGFVIQYWGEELTDISISGTTGTSGIEGINILDDIYRSEQRAINAVEINQQAQVEDEALTSWLDAIFPSLAEAQDFLVGFGDNEQNTSFAVPKPTLAYYASTVELYWGGSTYRGFFTNFNVTENADNVGWFNYDMKFKATLTRGRRANFMPWHRNPKPNGQQLPSSADFASTLSFYPVNEAVGNLQSTSDPFLNRSSTTVSK